MQEGMTLKKAIEILTLDEDCSSVEDAEDWKAAVRLGLEALKLIQRERLLGINPVETQLPGETRE